MGAESPILQLREQSPHSLFAGQLALEYLNSTVPVLLSMVDQGQGRSFAEGTMRDNKDDDVFIDIDKVGERVLDEILKGYPDKKISVFGEHSEDVRGDVDLIVVSDSFDNTTQYRRGLDTAPYTAMSVYDKNGRPLSSGISNLLNGRSTIAIDGKVYEYDFSKKRGIKPPKTVQPSSRRALNNKNLTIASYLGSNKYSLPAMDQFRSVYEHMHKKGVLYAGGGAFIYGPIAQGIVDAYIMPNEPNSETAAGAAMLQIAGGIVLVIEEDKTVHEWRFDPNRFDESENILVAAANLHVADKIIGRIDRTAQGNFRDLIAA